MLLVKPFYGLLETDPTGGGFSLVTAPPNNFGKFYVSGNKIFGANWVSYGTSYIMQSTNKGSTWSNASASFDGPSGFDFSVSASGSDFTYNGNGPDYWYSYSSGGGAWANSGSSTSLGYPVKTERDVSSIISLADNWGTLSLCTADNPVSVPSIILPISAMPYKMKAFPTIQRSLACTTSGLVFTNGYVMYTRTTANGLGSNTVYGGHMVSASGPYLAATASGLYRAVDAGGNTFTSIFATKAFADVVETSGANPVIYAIALGTVAGGGGLYVSKNAGASWKQYTIGLPSSIDSGARLIVSNYGGVVYIYVNSGGSLYRSHVSLP